ncbi:MAG: hypothetical protein KKA73_05365 [Chloroflexi bacterium]|nr:hypothetical protein [Chloroflexota bacterium]MBU1747096.1 hypothetical protein [Chloroflexota bacterium]
MTMVSRTRTNPAGVRRIFRPPASRRPHRPPGWTMKSWPTTGWASHRLTQCPAGAERRASGAGPGRAARHPPHHQRRHTGTARRRMGGAGRGARLRNVPPLRVQVPQQEPLQAAVTQLQMSARAHHRTRSVTLRVHTRRGLCRALCVARTSADLAGAEAVQPAHVAEAIHAKRRLRRFG